MIRLCCVKLILMCVIAVSDAWTDTTIRSFKKDFLFGAASAAYQVEGAWDTDGKGESIWDKFTHDNAVADGRNGDVAADSYNHYMRDVEMLRELGVDYYRFSVSWPRVMPAGFPNSINEKGLQYYDNLIDELLKYNIEPMVTLYHFDLPQALQDLGGWANPVSQYWFEDYAKVLFGRYASKVKYWITLNQPNSFCMGGYGGTDEAPGVNSKGIGEYMCVKNALLAHGRAYRLYEKEFKNKHKGSVGLALSVNWFDAFDNSTENVKATEEYREFVMGMFMNPIWSKEGDFPRIVREKLAKKSKEQGFLRSRLPELSTGEIKLLKGAADFLGVNHYTTQLVKRSKTQHTAPSFEDDVNVECSYRELWSSSEAPWLKNVPYGIYRSLVWINLKYDYPTLFITEHGWATGPGLRDGSRADNLRQYLDALLVAIEDGTNCKGYTHWSLMDNVEWMAGTSQRFGLYAVDFDSANKTRIARLSALVYKRIIETRLVDKQWVPDNLRIDISNRRSKKTKDEL